MYNVYYIPTRRYIYIYIYIYTYIRTHIHTNAHIYIDYKYFKLYTKNSEDISEYQLAQTNSPIVSIKLSFRL